MKLFNKTLSSDSHLHTNNLKSKSEIADDHKKIHMQIETEFHLRPSSRLARSRSLIPREEIYGH